MSFVNNEVDLEALPRFEDVELRRVDPRHPLIVLGIALAYEFAAMLAVALVLLSNPAPRGAWLSPPVLLIVLGVLSLAAAIAWYAYKSASVIRYAVRDHDVIVQSGVFWKRETIQPIRRIQHVEQLQGPVARRFGLSRIKLFSAGTGHSAFEIPGLQAQTAAQVRQSLLNLRESKLSAASSRPDAGDAAVAGERAFDDHA